MRLLKYLSPAFRFAIAPAGAVAALLTSACADNTPTAPVTHFELRPSLATATDDGQVLAYVADWNTSTVSVLETVNHTVIATIKMPAQPHTVVMTPDGEFVYVTHHWSNFVSVIETKSNTVAGKIEVGSCPHGIALEPERTYAYVANHCSGTVSVIDTKVNKAVNTITVGSHPAGLTVTPNGAFLYVANYGSQTVSVISTATNTTATKADLTFPTDQNPANIAFTLDGNVAYVTTDFANTVSVFETTNHQLVQKVKAGSRPWDIVVSPRGDFAYVSNVFGGVSVIKTADHTPVQTIDVEGGHGIAITPDGNFVYASGSLDGNTLSVIDVIKAAKGGGVTKVAVGLGPNGIAIGLVPPANSPPKAVIAPVAAGYPEGSTVYFDGTSSADPDGDPLSYAWDFGDGTTGTGVAPIHAYADNGSYAVTLTVSDGKGTTGTATVTVAVENVAPAVGAVSAPLDPQLVGTTVSTSAPFTDAGAGDTHTARIDWGDGTSSWATVGGGSASGGHAYAAAGVYTVVIEVTDDDGGVGHASFQYVVVYDPDAGFITGGGWIDSPAGACRLTETCDGATGKASFGFVSRYEKGATAPTGNTQFNFKAGELSFHSASYEWLVVSGPKAQYKGSGTINGAGDYGFILTANDGDVAGGGGVDRFRIKIWDKATGAVIYDNQMGDADDAGATTATRGGSIVIHR